MPKWKKPVRIVGENDGVKVEVQIRVLGRGRLTKDEVEDVRVGMTEAVMHRLSYQRYVSVALPHQKVSGV